MPRPVDREGPVAHRADSQLELGDVTPIVTHGDGAHAPTACARVGGVLQDQLTIPELVAGEQQPQLVRSVDAAPVQAQPQHQLEDQVQRVLRHAQPLAGVGPQPHARRRWTRSGCWCAGAPNVLRESHRTRRSPAQSRSRQAAAGSWLRPRSQAHSASRRRSHSWRVGASASARSLLAHLGMQPLGQFVEHIQHAMKP